MAIKSLAKTLKDLATGVKNTVTTVNKISDIMNIQSGLNPDGSSNGETPGTPTAGATDNTTDHSVIGDIKWSSADLTQAGFLIANGAEVGRATYPDLCAVYEAMGFPWGAGDGSTTFNLPNLIGKFAEGANSAGGYHEAGLPNITGTIDYLRSPSAVTTKYQKAFKDSYAKIDNINYVGSTGGGCTYVDFKASNSNAIYGNSTTVQPPSALLIPYVKAFNGASADSTDLAISEVANDVARLSANIVGKNECKSYVVESVVNEDGSWYRKYSDGWVEQGGIHTISNDTNETINYLKPLSKAIYANIVELTSSVGSTNNSVIKSINTTYMNAYINLANNLKALWVVCGMGAE